ncbi:amidohydrolase family protein [Glacieibacterium frigidum]|uniref:Amidohydrolase family protein n=1 Tax=Glacieibacterium frigidum TaxID=2593303 RepID=A0A552UFQ4_9SPHN|nr:amidohydrolase family protein [Glacieibacterium frigidum]TRW17021.1 amidohydrolase family protein [Glacieibacterium frigidum]
MRLLLILAALLAAPALAADMLPTPARSASEGAGPYPRLVIRGATIIQGDGAPPYGPADIVIEGNRIVDIRSAGTPGLPLKADREPRGSAREIDASGMFVLPGFVDTHAHSGDADKAPDHSYPYRLWLAHGVTTVRGVPLFGDPARSLDDKRRSAANAITAPRIYAYQTLGSGWAQGRVDTPDKARAWVRWAAAQGVDGIKFFNRGDETAAIIRAAIAEAKLRGLGTVAHLSQPGIAQLNAAQAGAAGLGAVTHFYGHFESLLKGRRLQDYPADYNFYDEAKRFGGIAEIWDQTHEPGGPEWQAYLEAQKASGVTFDPTFNIYSASRDLMRARNADWHALYTPPSLLRFYQSNRDNHGSYFYDWTTANEVTWRNFYARYMRLINDYKNIGGRVTAGSDSGFIFQTWGFGYVLELEMLQEAGFAPLEVIEAATWNGAQTLNEPKGTEPQFGVVRRGMLADLVIVPENPLQNLKTLYGTGTERLNERTNRQERVGGVRWTIKDGIVFDAPALLASVARDVAAEKARDAAAR